MKDPPISQNREQEPHSQKINQNKTHPTKINHLSRPGFAMRQDNIIRLCKEKMEGRKRTQPQGGNKVKQQQKSEIKQL